MVQKELQPVCEVCGAPAIVHFSGGDTVGSFRHYCLQCADEMQAAPKPVDRSLEQALALLVVGSFILGISVLADSLQFGVSAGFGWKQIAGLVLSGVLVLAGALMGVPAVLSVGLLFGGITILADWLGFGSDEGFGFQQMMGVVVGVCIILGGFVYAWTRRARAS